MLFPEFELLIVNHTNELGQLLKAAISQKTMTFDEVTNVTDGGLYIVFNNQDVLYIGKTTRPGRRRMTELAADFRSHTFNKKLLSMELKKVGCKFSTLKNTTKSTLIADGILTEEQFSKHQSDVNASMRKMFFKFLPLRPNNQLTALEHFAIAVLQPKFNDIKKC